MKRFINLFLILFSLLLLFPGTLFAQENGYEKYGRIATLVVREDYPGQKVPEYEYVGRNETPQAITDTFRFEVLENGAPKFVVVNVSHHPKNKKLLTISVREESRRKK